MATLRQPPQAPLKWSHGPQEIKTIASQAIDRSRSLQDRVAALASDKVNFDQVFRALALDDAELARVTGCLEFYQNVSTNDDVRTASRDVDKMLQEFAIESGARKDVFQQCQQASEIIDPSRLSGEEKRLVDKTIMDFRRNGLALADEQKDKLQNLKKELADVTLQFSKNANEEKGYILFTREELDGVPKDVINSFPESDGRLKMTFKTPDFVPVSRFAKSGTTRRRAFLGYEDRMTAAGNDKLFTRGLVLRSQIAHLLGYKNWAEYILEPRMAKNSKTVVEFLTDLKTKLKPLGMKELERLKALKKAELEERGQTYDGHFYIWDYRYYDRIYIEKEWQVDHEAIKQYFVVEKIIPAILKIYEELLSVKIEELKGSEVWHPEVTQFAVWNTSKDVKLDSDFLGYVALDLFPRENKYGHAAVWGISPGYTDAQGQRQYPVASMVANLSKPTPGKPALMKHDDVVTFFHEMGHVFHQLCAHTHFARFHGTATSRDFVEAPSQMLENWIWEPRIIKKISAHHETGEPLDDATLERLVKSREVGGGLFNLRQAFFGSFDINAHTHDDPGSVDWTSEWNELRHEISLMENGDSNVSGQATFAHLMSGVEAYSSGYYGYLYSLVFATDMFDTVFKSDPMNPVAGMAYRSKILGPGGSRDEMESLVDLLGRKPNLEAFSKKLGIDNGSKL